VEDSQMLTPSVAAAELMSLHGVKRVLVLGSPGVGHSLRRHRGRVQRRPGMR
jgi:hypothetical protein